MSARGEDFCLSNVSLMDNSISVALTYSECLTMHRECLVQILHRFPEERAVIRKAAIKIAVMRGVLVLASRRSNFRPKSVVLEGGKVGGMESGAQSDMEVLMHTVNRTENLVADLTQRMSSQEEKLNYCFQFLQAACRDEGESWAAQA